MSTEKERAATRERVRRFRERQKQEQEQLIRDKFEQGLRKFEPQAKPEAFEGQELFLKECSTAVDMLLEADSFLLWSLYPSESKALGVPLPQHINESNVDAAVAFVEAFASGYEQSQLKSVASSWAHAQRLCLLDGIIFDYHVDGGTAWVRISPGPRDLYRQLCKREGKELPPAFVKPEVVPAVPRTTAIELENRFLARCLALDKNFSLLPEGEGVIGQLITGGRACVVWEMMSPTDQQALATKVQREFASFCERQGKPLPQAPAQPSVSEILEPPAPEPERADGLKIGSICRRRGASDLPLTVTGFQGNAHAIVSFYDEQNHETIDGLVLPASSLVKT